MWHEARRREKTTQKLLNEHKKRAEKRREEDRVNPNSLLQIHGLQSKICLDPQIYKQAASSMVAWQGDESLLIDRFDVRATMSSIPEDSAGGSASQRTTRTADSEESDPSRNSALFNTWLNYERYRLLIQDDLNRVPEELRLKLVAKSDVASDAKLRKLRNNRFGTSGEQLVNTILSKSIFGSKTLQDARRNRSTKQGAIYNSVPPPSSQGNKTTNMLGNRFESSSDDHQSSLMDIADQLDEMDNLDKVDASHSDSKRINEVAKKYGMSGEEFMLMAKLDGEDIGVKDILRRLKRLTGRKTTNLGSQDSSSVYGPALPPELQRVSQKSPSHSSSNGSPIGQRSPSGLVDIPMRNGDISDKSSDTNEPNPSKNAQILDQDEKSSSNAVVRQPSLGVAPSTRVTCEPEGSHQARVLDESKSSDNERDKNGRQTVEESSSTDQRGSRSRQRSTAEQSVRRASTPLAYKRNRRSSRSLSRERRSKYRSSSSRRRRRSRSKSPESSRSSSSSLDSRRSNGSSEYSRRRRRRSPHRSNRRYR